jgi:hypothetical protein
MSSLATWGHPHEEAFSDEQIISMIHELEGAGYTIDRNKVMR